MSGVRVSVSANVLPPSLLNSKFVGTVSVIDPVRLVPVRAYATGVPAVPWLAVSPVSSLGVSPSVGAAPAVTVNGS